MVAYESQMVYNISIQSHHTGGINMRGYEAAQLLKEKGVTLEDVEKEIAYRKETNALSNNPQNEAFKDMTLNEIVRIKEMWNI